MAIKGAGSQGVQNGSISCIALPESLPGGVRGVLAENLIAALLDLEIASGNDAMASHSQIRKASKLMLQFLPGPISSSRDTAPCREKTIFSAVAISTQKTWTTTTSCSVTCRWTVGFAQFAKLK